jgi:hypothetical protein
VSRADLARMEERLVLAIVTATDKIVEAIREANAPHAPGPTTPPGGSANDDAPAAPPAPRAPAAVKPWTPGPRYGQIRVEVKPGTFAMERLVSFKVGEETIALFCDAGDVRGDLLRVALLSDDGPDVWIDLPREAIRGGRLIKVPRGIIEPDAPAAPAPEAEAPPASEPRPIPLARFARLDAATLAIVDRMAGERNVMREELLLAAAKRGLGILEAGLSEEEWAALRTEVFGERPEDTAPLPRDRDPPSGRR